MVWDIVCRVPFRALIPGSVPLVVKLVVIPFRFLTFSVSMLYLTVLYAVHPTSPATDSDLTARPSWPTIPKPTANDKLMVSGSTHLPEK